MVTKINDDLTDEIKARIVTELAVFRSTKEIREILLEEYEADITVQKIIRFDATKDYCIAGQALRELFARTRKEYVEGVADLHVSNVSYRLRRLQRMSERAEAEGKYELAASLLEQAAKDFGGAFTNVRQLTGKVQHETITPEKARETIAAFLEGRRGDKPSETAH